MTDNTKSCTCTVGNCALRAGREPNGECAMDRTVGAMARARSAPKRKSILRPEALTAYFAAAFALGAEDVDYDALGKLADLTHDMADIMAASRAMHAAAAATGDRWAGVGAETLLRAAQDTLTKRAQARQHGGTA